MFLRQLAYLKEKGHVGLTIFMKEEKKKKLSCLEEHTSSLYCSLPLFCSCFRQMSFMDRCFSK